MTGSAPERNQRSSGRHDRVYKTVVFLHWWQPIWNLCVAVQHLNHGSVCKGQFYYFFSMLNTIISLRRAPTETQQRSQSAAESHRGSILWKGTPLFILQPCIRAKWVSVSVFIFLCLFWGYVWRTLLFTGTGCAPVQMKSKGCRMWTLGVLGVKPLQHFPQWLLSQCIIQWPRQ